MTTTEIVMAGLAAFFLLVDAAWKSRVERRLNQLENDRR